MKHLLSLVIFFIFLSYDANAECWHYKSEPDAKPDLDGPGSWGPLHGMLSLDCLSLKGVIKSDEKYTAILIDDSQKIYKVTVGDYVGENSGRIVKITDSSLIIRQIIQNAQGEWHEHEVIFK